MRRARRIGWGFLAVLTACFVGLPAAAEGPALTFGDRTRKENQYPAYQGRYADAPAGGSSITIPAAAFSPESSTAPQLSASYHGEENAVLLTESGGDTLWNFTVETAGMYQVSLRFYSLRRSADSQEIGLHLDGQYPFAQAYSISLPQLYADEAAIQTDAGGNQYASRQVETYQWLDYDVGFAELGYDEPMRIYLAAGTHTLGIANRSASFALKSITLSPPPSPPRYADYLARYKEEGDAFLQIEGEDASLKSAPSLRPSTANGPGMSPYSQENIRINMIGDNWETPGQWLEWSVNVEKAGLYRVGCRYQQNTKKDFFVTRRLLLDGELPYDEARNIRFTYDSDWKFSILETADKQELLLYLTPGKHTLRLEVVIGPYRDGIQRLTQLTATLGELYRQIIVITGVSPDLYQDYYLERYIPELLGTLEDARDTILNEYRQFQTITDTGGAEAAFLQVFASQLEGMIQNPAGVPAQIGTFNSNIGSLSAWCQDVKSQPLELDYLYLAQKDAELPASTIGFAAKAKHEIIAFFRSFVEDYSRVYEESSDGKGSVDVWVSSSRDQAQVIRNMISDLFTPYTRASANLKLVNAGMVEAFLSGNTPDVVLTLGRSAPVNYAMRGLLKDLRAYPDFHEAKSWFMPTALEPYYFENGCFGLPDTQSFFVTFYRQDTFEQLGLVPPQTWEEFYTLVPRLQRLHLDVGIPYSAIGSAASIGSANIFPALLLQNGGSFFTDNLKSTALDTEAAALAFEQWCALYKEYGLDLTYDFFNRFRSGEMPLAIANYTLIMQLQAAAPELNGLWSIAPIPGVRREDGSIDRAQAADGSASVILSSTEKPELAWEFLKWWVGQEAQTRYAEDMQAQAGMLARAAVANVEAFRSLTWPAGMMETVYEQWKQVREVPEVTGGYLLTRGLDNAFRTVLYNGKSPRDSLEAANKQISEEIMRKRREFGLE